MSVPLVRSALMFLKSFLTYHHLGFMLYQRRPHHGPRSFQHCEPTSDDHIHHIRVVDGTPLAAAFCDTYQPSEYGRCHHHSQSPAYLLERPPTWVVNRLPTQLVNEPLTQVVSRPIHSGRQQTHLHLSRPPTQLVNGLPTQVVSGLFHSPLQS